MADLQKTIKGLETQLDDLRKFADEDEPLTLTQEQAKEILELLKEQEKALYELGQLLKERAEEIERLKTPTAGESHIPLRW